MLLVKQMDIRTNIKRYFDMAYGGETIFVPRKNNQNVVIMSEEEYNRLKQGIRVNEYARAVQDGKKTSENSIRFGTSRSHNLEKLDSIRSMKDNWNGNGAPAIPKTVTDRVEQLINGLSIQPEIFPTALGTIQLEYDNSRRDHMEIEIDGSDIAEVFVVRFNGEESYADIQVSIDSINSIAGDFYG